MKDDKELVEQIKNKVEGYARAWEKACVEWECGYQDSKEISKELIQLVDQHRRERLREAVKALFDSDAPLLGEKDIYRVIDEVMK